jgi:hypothetical protein
VSETKKIELTVVGTRCVYLNDHRIAGSKPYVSENLSQHSFMVSIDEILAALPMLQVKP